MRSLLSLAVAGIAISGVAVPMARAQRGVGDATGVVRQSLRPEIVLLSGKIIEVQTGPCAATTGRSLTGAHVILESPDKEQFNIHLGPAEALARVVARLSAGQEIAVRAFRTEQMKENHYVAQTLTVGKTTVELRDASLRPAWALGGTAPRGMAAGWAGRGRGRGGPGWGRGRGGWPAPQQPGAVIAERRPAATGKEAPGIRDIKQPATAGIIAVTAVEPSLDAALDPRFGRCRYILLVNTERETFEALENTDTAAGNAGVQAAETIARKGATVLLTGKCGPSASRALAAAQVRVVSGCSGTVRAVVKQFKAGQLPPASKAEAAPDSAPGKAPALGKRT